MELIPLFRTDLRGIKDNAEIDARIKFVDKYVQAIYTQVKRLAQIPSITSYKHRIELGFIRNPNNINNIRDNVHGILDKLRNLFPDSIVELKIVVLGEKHPYTITKIDDSIKPYIYSNVQPQFIVVDWS